MNINRENYISNARLEGHKWIPSFIGVSLASIIEHGNEIKEVMLKYPEFFNTKEIVNTDYSNIEVPLALKKDEIYMDNWGCKWKNAIDGIRGTVIEHPLDSYDKLDNFNFPDPNTLLDFTSSDYEYKSKEFKDLKKEGFLASAKLEHGHFFLRLADLRGYENLIFDMIDENPNLVILIKNIEKVMIGRINNYLKMDIDSFWLAEDLGMQNQSMISPDLFRKWVRPSYEKFINPLKEKDILVGLNPKERINSIDNLKKEVKGKACIRLDIDRQEILSFGTPNDVRNLIREEIEKLGSKRGGLELVAGIYPPVSCKNLDALCSAIKEFRTMHV